MEFLASVDCAHEDVTNLFTQDALSESNPFRVFTRNRGVLEQKLTTLVAGGKDKLKVVADFDFTLTKFRIPVPNRDDCAVTCTPTYNQGHSCHKVLEYSGFMSEEAHQKAKDLHAHYYPIEIDPLYPFDEKCVKMVEWCLAAHELIVAAGFSRTLVDKSVVRALEDHKFGFRKYVDSFLERSKVAGVPVLVFSAGIADVLERALVHLLRVNTLSEFNNIYVLSNRCIFDGEASCAESIVTEDDRSRTEIQMASSVSLNMDALAIGFAEPVIHVFNKHSSAFLHTPFFQHEEESVRKNVLLVGDSAGDVNMIRGMVHDNVLKVGFLNDSVAARFPHYLDIYDVVIVGEADFEVPLNILEQVLKV